MYQVYRVLDKKARKLEFMVETKTLREAIQASKGVLTEIYKDDTPDIDGEFMMRHEPDGN